MIRNQEARGASWAWSRLSLYNQAQQITHRGSTNTHKCITQANPLAHHCLRWPLLTITTNRCSTFLINKGNKGHPFPSRNQTLVDQALPAQQALFMMLLHSITSQTFVVVFSRLWVLHLIHLDLYPPRHKVIQ